MWVHIRHTSKEDEIRKGKPKLVLLPQGWSSFAQSCILHPACNPRRWEDKESQSWFFFISVCTTLHLSVLCAEACNPRRWEDKESQSWFFLVFLAQSHICSYTVGRFNFIFLHLNLFYSGGGQICPHHHLFVYRRVCMHIHVLIFCDFSSFWVWMRVQQFWPQRFPSFPWKKKFKSKTPQFHISETM